MLRAFWNALKLRELRGKILFTLLIIAVYRLGSHITVAGVNFDAAQRVAGQTGGVIGFVNLFSGGALTQMAIFALGIMPYITASIIMQLMGVVIPKLAEWQKEGETGYRKITQWTRYLTVVLAIVQSTGLAFLFHRGQLQDAQGQPVDLIPNFTPPRVALIVLTLTAGTALIMWLGELVTQRGIGNGMSILIFASVISRFPFEGVALVKQLPIWGSVMIFLGGLAIIIAIILVEQGQRRIQVQYAKRVVGRRMYGGSSTYIPLKVNQAGVIPIIFASSLLAFPSMIATAVQWKWLRDVIENHITNPASLVYILIYGVLIVFFAYFYTAISFNPLDVADNMRKHGGFVPGIRPGGATVSYLERILTRITLPGSLFIAGLAVLPSVVLALLGIEQFPFGGTSILIVVGVALETMKQLESQLTKRQYEGFLQ